MSSDKLLSQDEINALLGINSKDFEKAAVTPEAPEVEELLPDEKDALGEIGNISMGSAATTLSMLLNQRVNITSPVVTITKYQDLITAFIIPYLTIRVEYIEGLQGFNFLVMRLEDAIVIADLMMGGDGSRREGELTDIEISAAAEAMNQMIGTSATSLATMFSKTINISPPITEVIKEGKTPDSIFGEDTLVVSSFRMTIGDLVDTEIMQIMGVPTAKEEAKLLFDYAKGMSDEQSAEIEEVAPEPTPVPTTPPPPGQPEKDTFILPNKPVEPVTVTQDSSPAAAGLQYNQQKLDLLLDIPLKVSVILGRTKRPIKDVLNYSPGSIVELSSHVDEPVDILVNGTLVAKGEVVVVNDNFGVKITSIISPSERVQYLANK